MSREVRVELMRPAQIVEAREECPLVFLPLGPLEWHGPHLPVGTDPLNAQEVARRLAREVGGVVLPTLFMGTERERSPEMLRNIGFRGDEYIVGMDFPANTLASLYFPEELLALVIRSYLALLERIGYRMVVLLNGHGAANQIATLERLAVEFCHTTSLRVLHLLAIPGYTRGEYSWSHATRGETAIMQACFPESVDLSTLPEQEPLANTQFAIVDDRTFRGEPTCDWTLRAEESPHLATPAEGEARFQAITQEFAEVIRAELANLA